MWVSYETRWWLHTTRRKTPQEVSWRCVVRIHRCTIVPLNMMVRASLGQRCGPVGGAPSPINVSRPMRNSLGRIIRSPHLY